MFDRNPLDLVLHTVARPSAPAAAGFSKRRCCLLAVGGFVLAQLAGPAGAQNCTSYTPGPAAPGSQADVNVANGTFTPANPLAVDGSGAEGCDGAEGFRSITGSHADGGLGQEGGAGASFSAAYTNTTVTQSGFEQSGGTIYADGGSGGTGGFPDQGQDNAGSGGNGGVGGSLTARFDNSRMTVSNGGGLTASASGGSGGFGSATNPNGNLFTARRGAAGGAGGQGGTLRFTMSGGSIQVGGAFGAQALVLEANGGAGGGGGSGRTVTAESYGGAGGRGPQAAP